jgi:hypothetical protein
LESLPIAGSLQRELNVADEKMRVVAFDTVDLDDGDWDGPTAHGEFLSYTSKHAAASITRLGQPDGISPSRMAEMLEVDKAGPKVWC